MTTRPDTSMMMCSMMMCDNGGSPPRRIGDC